ncbi:MAG TPA: toprim domain-containing protein [Xanthobacteraceae bacterium]|nr:toprim domain-containing protein [Xanthobacteraceae bacterium]
MSAEGLARALGGRKAGVAWMARCPVHDDREPSLSIADARGGKVLVRCHAGCDQRDVIAALRARGIWGADDRRPIRFSRKLDRVQQHELAGDAIKRTEAALAIWHGTQSAEGTPVETYLRSRGVIVPIPPSIRFHAGLKHPSGAVWPGMVALVTHGAHGKRIGIHRTFLTRDGSAKAPVEPKKMMLGLCCGGALRLAHAGDVLMVGEGIETCLAAMQASGHTAWAALSTSGLRALDLPREVRDVIVLADGDDPGEAAALNCAWRWKREGRRVRIARAPQGMDFNDLLLRRAPRIEEVAR